MSINYELDYFAQDPDAKELVSYLLQLFESEIEKENYQSATRISESLSQNYPGYFYGYFAEARCLSEDFRRIDLLQKAETKDQFDKILDLLKKSRELAPEQTAAEIEEIIVSFTDKSEKSLAESFIDKFNAIYHSLFEVEKSSRYSCPIECSESVYIAYSKCEFFRMLMADKGGTFYTLNYDLVKRVGKKYPSIQLIKLHEKVIDYCISLIEKAESKKLSALLSYNTQVAMRGIEYSYDHEFKEEIWRYFPYSPYSGPSLESILKENKLDFSQAAYDKNLIRAFRTFFDFMNNLQLNIGNLSDIGLPQEYISDFNYSYGPIKQKFEEEEKENAENAKKAKKKGRIKTVLFVVAAILIGAILLNLSSILSAIFG